MSSASENISAEELQDYKEAFALLDKDKDGEITKSDLRVFMKSCLDETPSESELQEMITEVDIDGNGSICFKEFLKLLNDIELENERDMIEAFRVFDIDANGFISASELKHIMSHLGETLTDEEVEEFINLIDIDGDGLINYEEFAKVIQGKGKS